MILWQKYCNTALSFIIRVRLATVQPLKLLNQLFFNILERLYCCKVPLHHHTDISLYLRVSGAQTIKQCTTVTGTESDMVRKVISHYNLHWGWRNVWFTLRAEQSTGLSAWFITVILCCERHFLRFGALLSSEGENITVNQYKVDLSALIKSFYPD